MTKYFLFTYVDEGISARAILLESEAPQTVETLWKHAPYGGDAVHASYSGSTVGLLFDPTIVIPTENATNYIQTRDLMYTHYPARTRFGHPDALTEIYWAYDRYCRPIMPGTGLAVYPNVFGQFVGDYEKFFAASRAVQIEGPKKLTVTALEE